MTQVLATVFSSKIGNTDNDYMMEDITMQNYQKIQKRKIIKPLEV